MDRFKGTSSHSSSNLFCKASHHGFRSAVRPQTSLSLPAGSSQQGLISISYGFCWTYLLPRILCKPHLQNSTKLSKNDVSFHDVVNWHPGCPGAGTLFWGNHEATCQEASWKMLPSKSAAAAVATEPVTG